MQVERDFWNEGCTEVCAEYTIKKNKITDRVRQMLVKAVNWA